MNIIKPSVCMKLKSADESVLETQCLYGETIEILDEHFDWVYCKLNTDNYCGWVKKKGLGKLNTPTHRVHVKRSFVYSDKNPKANCLFYLPMGAKLAIEDIKFDWAEIKLDYYNTKIGYVPSDHLVNLDHKVKDWVAKAQQLEGTPYQWGGRDSIGIDCSALLQLSYQTYGQNIPRNSSQQLKLNKKYIQSINDLKRGCVIFWENHVGIMIDNVNCIHANSFFMKTKTEPLSDIIKRVGENLPIKKMMDFN